MNAKAATWQEQLATIKHTMQAAREAVNQPRPKRGRRHRGKVQPERKPADTSDAGKREREHEEAERRAREEQAEIARNPYGSTLYPAD